MNLCKRGLALLLSAVMLFSLTPVPVFASEPEETEILAEAVPEAPEIPTEAAPENPEILAEAVPEAPTEGSETPEETAPENPEIPTEAPTSRTKEKNPASGAILTDAEKEKQEEPPAYEISYNLSGSGFWMTIGGDTSRAETDSAYDAFDEKGNYIIQMRENDDFPYTVEIRWKEKEGDQWSVPEKYRFYNSDTVYKIKGHQIGVQSKWLTAIEYQINGAGDWIAVALNDFDENGDYAIPLDPDQISFPLYLSFRYRDDSGKRITVLNPEGEAFFRFNTTEDDPVNVQGHNLSLKFDQLGMAQYSVNDNTNWTLVGPGRPQQYEFDAHGNYTIDLGNFKSFPVRIYIRFLDVDGWHYIDDGSADGARYKSYANVLDTATVSGHVFAIHTDWMYDVKFALVEDSDFETSEDGETKTFIVPPDNDSQNTRWYTVGADPRGRGGVDDYYNNDGNYAINMDSTLSDLYSRTKIYPFQLVFKAIGPDGKWDDGADWAKDNNLLKRHLLSYNSAGDVQNFEGHDFSLITSKVGEVSYTLYYTPVGEEEYIPAESREVVTIDKDHKEENYPDHFDENGDYVIEMLPDWTYPIKISFEYMMPDGRHNEDWEILNLESKDAVKDIENHKFSLNYTFLDNIRFKRDSSGSDWIYLIPEFIKNDNEMIDLSQNAKYYHIEYSNFERLSEKILEYEDGGYTLKLSASELGEYGTKLFVNTGTEEKPEYALNPALIIQTWDGAEGWRNADINPFSSLKDKREIRTPAGENHTFGLYSPYTNEIRYFHGYGEEDGISYSYPDFRGWHVVGENQELATESFDKNKKDFTIEMLENYQFPLETRFQIYTERGWTTPNVEKVVKPQEDQEYEAGINAFIDASSRLKLTLNNETHIVSVHYPWANSVKITFEDRVSDNDAAVSNQITVGPDEEYAKTDDSYFYAKPNEKNPTAYVIDMDEGDFFPFHVSFETRDNAGKTAKQTTPKDGEEPTPYEFTYTKNTANDVYTISGYRFSVHSYWMDTVRIYLPGRTVSVGTGEGVPQDWMEKHKTNYKLYDRNGNYTIELRQGDDFPLTVEFLKRSLNAEPKPEKHVFQNMDSVVEFDRHIFRLTSNYADAARYIISYGENVADADGNLNPGFENRAVTVVNDASWTDHHANYESFDADGNFLIRLPDDSALPVDIWFAVADENGSFENSKYWKKTFETKEDKALIMPPTPEPTTPPAITTTPTPTPEPRHVFSIYANWMDEVFYTLPQMPNNPALPAPKEITVGTDQERAKTESEQAKVERRDPLYVTYEQSGSYTIELEEDAFFPYVIHFKYRSPVREGTTPLLDPDGNPVQNFQEPILDEKGQPIPGRYKIVETDKVQRLDENGKPIWEPVLDKDGNPVLDENNQPKQQPVYEQMTDQDGNPVWEELADGKRQPVWKDVKTYRGAPVWKEGDFEFTTPNVSRVINGHTFKVHSSRSNPNAAVRINLVLGTHTIPLRLARMPETPDIAWLQSTQALPEVQLEADLRGAFDLELADARVEVFKWDSGQNREVKAAQFVWGEWDMAQYYSGDGRNAFDPWNPDEESVKYRIINSETKLDLSDYAMTEERTQYFEVISGSLDQLDLNNIRYVIKTLTQYPETGGLLDMKFAYMDDRRGGVYVYHKNYEHYDKTKDYGYQPKGLTTTGRDAYTYTEKREDGEEEQWVDVYRITVNDTWQDGRLWLTMKLNDAKNARGERVSKSYDVYKDLEAEIYEGFYFTVEDAQKSGKNIVTVEGEETGRTISELAWEKELDTQRIADRYAYPGNFVNGPNGIENGPQFTIVWKRDGSPVSIMPFRVIVDVSTTPDIPENVQNPEDIAPIRFEAPHTYSDFILDENGNMPPTTYLERINEIVDPNTKVLSAYYWTATEGNLYDNRYYVRAVYNIQNSEGIAKEDIKIYAGSQAYDNLSAAKEAAAGQSSSRAMDVTEQVFSQQGYGADYSEGVYLSVFRRNGERISCRMVQTIRREILYFGTLEGLDFYLDSDMTLNHEAYKEDVTYHLPESEYRGVYNGRATYTIPITYLRDYVTSSIADYGVRIVVGDKHYETYGAAMSHPDTMKDITDMVEYVEIDGQKVEVVRYRAAYRNKIYFNLYNEYGERLDQRTVTTIEPPKTGDTFFEAYGAKSVNGKSYLAYSMPGNMDGYRSRGYQTIFILNQDKSPVTDKEIIPVYEFHNQEEDNKLFITLDKVGVGVPVLENQRVDFTSGKPIYYAVSSANETDHREYQVTYVTQQEGARLFVNTENNEKRMVDDPGNPGQKIVERDVFIQETFGNYHDIFIANIGDEPLEGITVSFEKGENANLYVDDYWTIREGTSANTLAAFDDVLPDNAPGRDRYANYLEPNIQLPNVAKIRLYPKRNARGEVETDKIDDVLIISTRNGGETRIKLTGVLGEAKITTEALTGEKAHAPNENYDDYSLDPVKYVGFSRMIMTNWDLYNKDGEGVTFEVTKGRLPNGFPVGYSVDETNGDEDLTQQIKPNGELFGVPTETGSFTFTVTATFQYPPNVEDPIYYSQDSKEYTLNVLENEDDNVWGRISDEYEVLEWMPDIVINVPEGLDDAEINQTAAPLGFPGSDKKTRRNVASVTLTEYPTLQFKYAVKDDVTNGVQDYDWQWRVFLNGEPLKDDEYIRRRGSDNIDILAKTLRQKFKLDQTNTISVVNRSKNNSEWKKVVSTNVDLNVNGKKKTETTPKPTLKPVKTRPTTTPKPSAPTTAPTGNPAPNPGPRTRYYSVTTVAANNGTFSVSDTSVIKGKTVKITPNPAASYRTGEITVKDSKGNVISVTENKDDGTFSFVMPGLDVSVEVTFERTSHPVTHNPGTAGESKGGSLTSNVAEAVPGETVTLTAVPDNAGYELERAIAWTYDNATNQDQYLSLIQNADGTISFVMPESQVWFRGSFRWILPFDDIKEDYWALEHIVWTYKRGIMRGVTADNEQWTWEPESTISAATAILTLARMFNVDLEKYWPQLAGVDHDPGLTPEQTLAVRWAREVGLLDGVIEPDAAFPSNDEPMPRGQFALILANYLKSVAKTDVTVAPENQITFPDAERMTQPQNAAFQILRQAKILEGDTEGKMLPLKNSKRSHLAKVLQRLYNYIAETEAAKTAQATQAQTES